MVRGNDGTLFLTFYVFSDNASLQRACSYKNDRHDKKMWPLEHKVFQNSYQYLSVLNPSILQTFSPLKKCKDVVIF